MSDKMHERTKRAKRERMEGVRAEREATWLILCEGAKTEPNYFNGLIRYLNENGHHICAKVEGVGKNTESLVTSVEEYFGFVDKEMASMRIPYSNIIFAFDKDDFGPGQFNSAVRMAQKTGGGISQVVTAWSNECFELWLCLHFELIQSAWTREQYFDKLTEIFRRSGVIGKRENYKDTVSTSPRLFEYLLKSGGDVGKAVRHAESLARDLDSRNSPAKCNPATMMHEAVKALGGRFL